MNVPAGPCDLHDPRRSKRPRKSAGDMAQDLDEPNPSDRLRHNQPFDVAGGSQAFVKFGSITGTCPVTFLTRAQC